MWISQQTPSQPEIQDFSTNGVEKNRINKNKKLFV